MILQLKPGATPSGWWTSSCPRCGAVYGHPTTPNWGDKWECKCHRILEMDGNWNLRDAGSAIGHKASRVFWWTVLALIIGAILTAIVL